MTIILITIAGCFLFFLVLAGAAVLGWFIYRNSKIKSESSSQFIESIKKLTEASDKLAIVSEKLAEVSADFVNFPKLLAGQIKASSAMVIEISKLRAIVQELQVVLTGGTGEKKQESGLSIPSEEDAERHFTIAQFIAEDPSLSIDRAAQLADEDIARRASMGGIGID